jgi:hypothetical protein
MSVLYDPSSLDGLDLATGDEGADSLLGGDLSSAIGPSLDTSATTAAVPASTTDSLNTYGIPTAGSLFGAGSISTNPTVASSGTSGVSTLSSVLGLTSQAANAASQVLYAAGGPSTATRVLGAIGATTGTAALGKAIPAAPTLTSSGGLLLLLLLGLLAIMLMRREG